MKQFIIKILFSIIIITSCSPSTKETQAKWPNGNTKIEFIWSNIQDSIYIINEYYETGSIKNTQEIKFGLKNGKHFYFREAGGIAAEQTYINDTLNGKIAEYYKNGQEMWIGKIERGKPKGTSTDFYPNGMKMREIKTLPKPIKYINFWDSTNVQTLNSGTGYFIEFAYGGTKDSSILIPYKKVTVKDSLIVKVVKIKKQQPTPK